MLRGTRAIIIKDNQLLVMHRNKFGKEYDTLPGGIVGFNEDPERALLREMVEETQVKFANQQLVFLERSPGPYGDQYVYLCDYVSGEPSLNEGSDEHIINQAGEDLYKMMWLNLSDLPSRIFVSEKLKRAILKYHQQGWPKRVLEIA